MKRFRTVFLAFLVRWVLRLLLLTTRRVVGDRGEAFLARVARGERTIVAFWHGHLALAQLVVPPGRFCVQISRHGDGEVIARAIGPLGVRAARGSATRGGVGSVREMLRAFEEGYELAVVCDGPRGPRHVVKPGAVQLAAATGAPLYPVAGFPRRGWVSRRSWDRFVVPFPFSRIVYAVGEPLRVPRDASPEALEQARLELENGLKELTKEVERLAGATSREAKTC